MGHPPSGPRADPGRRTSEGPQSSGPDDRSAEIEHLYHELQVHQVELEQQNAELRAARAETEEALSNFVDLYDFAPSAYLTLDRDGVITEANLAATALLGVPRVAIRGRRIEGFVGVADRAVLAAFLAELAGQVTNTSGEIPVVARGHEPVACLWSGSCDPATGARRIVIVDVSEQRRAEEALRASETLYRGLVNALHDGMIVCGPDGRVITSNPRAADILGRTQDELVGMTSFGAPWVATDEDDIPLPSLLSPVQVTLRTRQPVRDTVIGLGGDGWHRWLTISCEPLALTSGQLSGVVVSFADITARRESEIALAASERRYREALDGMLEAVVILDHDQRCTYLNEVAARGSAIAPPEAYGRQVMELFPAIADGELPARAAAGMRDSRPDRFLTRHTLPDGTDGWAEISLRPTPEGLFVLAVDRTESQRAQEALRLANERLIDAQRLEAIGRLAGGVAHDFNNILMAITGTAELLAQSLADDDERHADVEMILDAGARAAALTRQLLAFGRRQPLRPTAVSLEAAIRTLASLLRRTVGEDVRLDLDFERGVAPVLVDPVQFEQVVINLVFNARDAMPDGGSLAIRVRSREVTPDEAAAHAGIAAGSFACLEVRDSGTGIAADVLPHLFEPFYTTKGLAHGSGLGLATVEGIVAQSNGWIDVESEVGGGSVFRVYLPTCTGESTAGAFVVRDTRIAPATAGAGAGEVILLVEDEASVRRVTTRLLEELGYRLLVADGPAAVLALAPERLATVQLLVTDMVMPGMSGRSLARALRNRMPSLPVLLISGFIPDAGLPDDLTEPATQFLPKPFTRDEIATAVRVALDQGRSGG
ncbi:MAG: PAS domain-containing protein [Chloroflexota bacterium]